VSLISNLLTWLERSRLRQDLLKRDERSLADIGIARDLLEAGVRAWPWLAPSDPAAGLGRLNFSRPTERDYAKAIAELRGYSDADLSDLGLTRGGIDYAVRHGRAGFPEDRAAPEQSRAPRKAA